MSFYRRSLFVLCGLALSIPAPVPLVAPPASAEAPAGLRVVVVNVHEGSLLRPQADQTDGTDRRRFAARALNRGAVPDVVLLQEALGSATRVARALNRHPRAVRQGARFRVVRGTSSRLATGRCDGPRTGTFRVLRSSAVLVNTAAVGAIERTGAIRTWGRWNRRAWHRTGRRGHGCAAHPWVQLRIDGGSAVVSSVHLAPERTALKTRAMRVVGEALDREASRAQASITVLGGDLNLNRCRQPLDAGERRVCRERVGHQRLLDAGFRDVVRRAHPTGRQGVAGVARRVDFLYARAEARDVWWDRCYRAFLVRKWPCSQRRAVFESKPVFGRCSRRSTYHGRPSTACPPRLYRRYLSDHPVLVGTLTALP